MLEEVRRCVAPETRSNESALCAVGNQPRPPMSRNNLVFLAASVVVSLSLLAISRMQDCELLVESSFLQRRFSTPLLNIRAKPSDGAFKFSVAPKVLLIHGLAASKSALIQMGSELARWGFDCLLMDLPGHGASVETFSRRAALEAVEEVATELVAGSVQLSAGRPIVILIGHSFGAGLAIEAGRKNPQIGAVVAISPPGETASRTEPPRLLVLLGEFDFPFVRRGAAFLYEAATGARLPLLDKPGSWQNPENTRRLVVLPWTDHTQGIFSPRSLSEIRSWLARINPETRRTAFAPWKFWLRVHLRALLCLSLLLLWIPLVALLGDWLRVGPDGEEATASLDFTGGQGLFLLWIYAGAGGAATLVLLAFNPWKPLNLMGGAYLSGFLFITGAIGCALTRPILQEIRCSGRSAGFSLLAVLILLGSVAPFVTSHFVHLELLLHRLWRFPWIAASVLPFYLFDEWVCRRRLQKLGWIRLTLFHLSTRLVLTMVLLLGFFVLKNSQFLIVLVLPGLLLTSFLCWCFAGWICRRTGSVAASTLFSTLTTAWFFSVFFNQT
jgi:pimeloyl-ACP methyl ester carboxylesterase